MLDAAAKAIAQQVDPTFPGSGLLPDVTNLPQVSVHVAEAVYHAAVADGVATKTYDDVAAAIVTRVWRPRYDD
jgi:malate dehydrogenase (oxaloacetate-decarboxylating)